MRLLLTALALAAGILFGSLTSNSIGIRPTMGPLPPPRCQVCPPPPQ